MLTYIDRKDSQAELVNTTSQAHSRAAAERPDPAENQEPCPVPPMAHLCCGLGCGQSGVGLDWFMACQGGMPGLHSKTAQIWQEMKTHPIPSRWGTARILGLPPLASPHPPPSTLTRSMETSSQEKM